MTVLFIFAVLSAVIAKDTADSTECLRGVPTTVRLLTLLNDRRDDPSTKMASSALGIRPALDLAAEQINNRPDLLPCHKLELVHKEAGCVVGAETAVGLTTGLFPSDSSGGITGVIGPFCSPDSIHVSSITNRPELQIVVLHNSWSHMLSNRTRFPNMLGILGSPKPLEDLLQVLIRKSGWHNVAILYENARPFYSSLTKSFIASIKDMVNIRHLSTVASNFYPLQEVWNSKARVVFLFTSTEHSRRIMCLAYHMKLVYPSYQWVVVSQGLGDFNKKDDLFMYLGKEYRCLPSLLVNISLEGALLINYQLSTASPEEITFANTTFKRFLELYKQRVDEYNSEHPDRTISTSYRAYNMYDAVWAWAIVLDEVMSNNSGLTFEYGKKTLANLVLDSFYSIDFQGMSGHISFNSTSGFVYRPADLYQIVSREKRHIAYSNGTEVITLQDFKTIPDMVVVVSFPHKGISGFFLAIQCVETVVVAILHFLTFMYRNTKLVKASSPKLVHAAFLGTYMFILTMMLYTVFFMQEHSPIIGMLICQSVWAFFMPISFTLTMGIVSLRTWRLYRIFTHYLNPGKSISNPALLSALIAMVSIDLLIGAVWTTVDRMRFSFIEFTSDNRPANELLLDQSCFSRYNFVWMCIVFSYRFFLLFVMVTLALVTRKIPNQTFSTTSLRLFSYAFSTVMVIGFCLYFFFLYLDPRSNNGPILLCTILNVMLLLFLVCILTPPLIPILQDKLKIKLISHQ